MYKITKVPMFLTSLRLALIPFIWLGAYAGSWKVVFWLFLLASITDVLDGFIARRYHCVTRFGAAFDPFVDKVLVLSIYAIMLLFPYLFGVPHWFVWLMVIKELLLSSGALYFGLMKKKVVVSAAWPGKFAGFLQAIFIFMWLGGLAFWREVVAFVGLGFGVRVLSVMGLAFRILLFAVVGANLFALFYYLFTFFSERRLKYWNEKNKQT